MVLHTLVPCTEELRTLVAAPLVAMHLGLYALVSCALMAVPPQVMCLGAVRPGSSTLRCHIPSCYVQVPRPGVMRGVRNVRGLNGYIDPTLVPLVLDHITWIMPPCLLAYEYGGSNAEYSDDTSDCKSTQDVNSEDDSTQNIRGDPQGIEGFVITDIKLSIKTIERLRRFLHPFNMDPSVAFRVPNRDDDPNRSKAGDAFFHTGLAPGQLAPNSWRSLVCYNLCFIEESSGLHSHIEFAKNQPAADRRYKNLLKKVAIYFSREALFGEENLTHPTLTMERMKKKLGEMKKSEAREKRGNDGSEGFQSKKRKSSELSIPPLTPSSLPSRSLNPIRSSSTTSLPVLGSSPAQLLESSTGSGSSTRMPSGSFFGLFAQLPGFGSPAFLDRLPTPYILTVQTPKGFFSSIFVSVPLKLSYFIRCSTKILSFAVINEMEAIPLDMQASLLTTLEAKMRLIISKLQDSLSWSEARIKELEANAIQSEEVNKKKVMELDETVAHLEEKSAKPI
ncbi:hypothetical protein FNV43_RR16958 [Rhamnella rubrinervis]|uniref:Uncharacterized protein n=1 Tax=Rhamnella rubrinervis TaxID=2594499 RepID=A0A8K0GZR2_9ROSA|nr:hypothetical protein FNV43_RR16958 [Rhamnella rubrinervis]